MLLFNILNYIVKCDDKHFISVHYKIYEKWKYLIKLAVLLNPNYKICEIYRKKFKYIDELVVVGLKFNKKKIKRRAVGWAKRKVEELEDAKCIYCGVKLDSKNATTDHIIPISKYGNNSQVNLIVCCSDCNNERGDLEFKRFLSIKNKNWKDIKFL